MSTDTTNGLPAERGVLLSATLIGILLALLCVLTVVERDSSSPALEVWTGLYIQVWGWMFLAAYYYSHKSFFLRGLMWVCEHFSVPPGRRMAFFYFGLCFLLGGVAILKGLSHL
jgi:hypothetical protein